jgi:hypothetical protein
MKYKIAYLDENDGWINTFYQTFKADFEVLRIKVDGNTSIDELVNLLVASELNAIVTDYLLEEEGNVSFNGNKIVEEFKKKRPHFPIIMLTSHPIQAIGHTDDVHIIYNKDVLTIENENDQDELKIFKNKIFTNITNYYKKIDDTNTKIEYLIEKRNAEGLDIKEEEEISKLYILFDELNPEGKDLPANLINRESITKLNEFVKETKEILEELKKLNQK